ncbi:Hypothetical predicted protein [Lynx pardinus]|uniref:Uncharacterized protein n=1 Tax=Lynx pardinus TaxID=191816 RepID=A0A485N7X6_LYNPA|nr:Hypothetical predicted protein [Lynx pardinus]
MMQKRFILKQSQENNWKFGEQGKLGVWGTVTLCHLSESPEHFICEKTNDGQLQLSSSWPRSSYKSFVRLHQLWNSPTGLSTPQKLKIIYPVVEESCHCCPTPGWPEPKLTRLRAPEPCLQPQPGGPGDSDWAVYSPSLCGGPQPHPTTDLTAFLTLLVTATPFVSLGHLSPWASGL